MKAEYEAMPNSLTQNYDAKDAIFPPDVLLRFYKCLPFIRERARMPDAHVHAWVIVSLFKLFIIK